ncbi:UNVERIFIED_CONTAM: AUGMIN subunit [Sesamum calycinum]|uniref:AUGMIN subunit n=1 Tax=Sesamum calycinum TaxID=2727403 RepID=A0AAW2Q4X2_9LAMI
MAKIFAAQNLPADVSQVMDQLERHCLAPDGSLISKSTYYDLQLAREEMCKERQRYLEALAVYIEAMAMVEEYQQAVSVANLGGIRDVQGLYPQLGLRNSPQVPNFKAAQKLASSLSKDGEIHEEEIEKWSIVSRSSLDSTSTSVTISSSTNSTNYTNVSAIGAGASVNNPFSVGVTDASEPEVGGVPNRFLGITPAYLWQTQLQQAPPIDITEYQVLLAREIASRLDAKCDKLADAVVIDDMDSSSGHQNLTSRLPERVLVKPHSSAVIEKRVNVPFEHLFVTGDAQQRLTQSVAFNPQAKLIRPSDLDLVLEHILLLETYTTETIPALHKIRKYLVESTEEASLAYNKAVTRLREYQGVDAHFDTIARQYHDIVKKLENMQWTIHQVEMDLKRLPDHPSN